MVGQLVAVFDQGLALGEVVQRAKLVLQLLQRGERRFPPLGTLSPGKTPAKNSTA